MDGVSFSTFCSDQRIDVRPVVEMNPSPDVTRSIGQDRQHRFELQGQASLRCLATQTPVPAKDREWRLSPIGTRAVQLDRAGSAGSRLHASRPLRVTPSTNAARTIEGYAHGEMEEPE